MTSFQFLNHILSSFGVYETEIYLPLHGAINEQFRNKKIIGMNDDEESLQIYSNELCKRYINEQVRFYPISVNVLQN